MILDPNRLWTSTCDHLTGQWSELPKCICPDPFVPDSKMIQRDDFSAQFECIGGFSIDANGAQVGTCDPRTGWWIELPRCIRPATSVPESTLKVGRSYSFTEIPSKNPFLSSKELDTLISNPLPGSRPRTRFTWEGPDPAIGDMANNLFKNGNKFVPVNAQVANRPSVSVISIIAVQLCAFSYFIQKNLY